MLASIILCHNVAKTQIRFCGWWWVFMIFIIMNATGTPNTHLLKLLAITPFTSKGQLPQDLGIKCGSIYNFHDNHVIGVCPPSQSESQNWAQPRNKRPHAFAHLVIATKMCLSWLIIIQSCSFDCRINKPFDTLTVWSAFLALFTLSRHTTCAKDHGLLYLNYPQINEVGKSDHNRRDIDFPRHLVL